MARRLGRLLAGGCAAAVLAAGCGQAGDDAAVRTGRPADFAATSRYLVGVVDEASEQPYRFTVTTGVVLDRRGGPEGEAHAQLATGAFDGERTQVRMDLAAVAAAEAEATGERLDDLLPPGVAREDLVMEVVTEPGTAYMRTPYVQAVVDGVPATALATAPPGFVELAEALAAGWVSIDAAALGDVDPKRAADAVAGDQNCDPAMYLDLVRDSESVEEIGGDEIAGTRVTGLAADVRLEDLIRRQGGRLPTSRRGDAADLMVPVEVWVDGEGQIRRVHLALDMLELVTELEGAPPGELGELEGFTVTQTLDLSGYGDDSIEVEVPTGAVDMTAAFADMLRAARGLPTGPGAPPLDSVEDDLAALEDLYAGLGGPGDIGSLEPPPFDPPPFDPAMEEAYEDLGSYEIPESPPIPPMPEFEIPEVPEVPEFEIPEVPEMPDLPPPPTMPPPPPPPPPSSMPPPPGTMPPSPAG